MRMLGMLGGMAWPSTHAAYRQLNEEIADRLGGVHSARLVLWSADFAEIETRQSEGRWDECCAILGEAARGLAGAGAEGLLLVTNTMHRCADAIEDASGLPLLHVVDATAAAIRARGIEQVALLGTRYTMEGDFYRGRLAAHGLDVRVPDAEGRRVVDDIIFGELVRGVVRDGSRAAYTDIVTSLVADGATGVVAGCTEVELLLRAEDVAVDYFPTTRILIDTAVDWMLGGPVPAPPPTAS